LVLHPTKPVDRSIETIIAAARGMPVRLLAREIDRHRVPVEVSVVPDAQFVAELDGLVTLGGDGTMLGGMRLVIDRPVPVLWVYPWKSRFLRGGGPRSAAVGAEAARRGRLLHRAVCVPGGGRGRNGLGDPVRIQRRGAGAVPPRRSHLPRPGRQRPSLWLLPGRRRRRLDTDPLPRPQLPAPPPR